VRYDPAKPTTALVADGAMPMSGPRTPNDLVLLGSFAGTSVVLLLVAIALRRRG